MIFIIKLLKQGNVNLNMIIREEQNGPINLRNLLPWMSELNLLDLTNYKCFQVPLDPAVTQEVINLVNDTERLKGYLNKNLAPNGDR